MSLYFRGLQNKTFCKDLIGFALSMSNNFLEYLSSFSICLMTANFLKKKRYVFVFEINYDKHLSSNFDIEKIYAHKILEIHILNVSNSYKPTQITNFSNFVFLYGRGSLEKV